MLAHESCLHKQKQVIHLFADCATHEQRYLKIIELGRNQPPLNEKDKISENIVKGCQSVMFLVSSFDEGLVTFSAESEALISAGLAAILIAVYSGETAETILTCPPDYLEHLGLSGSLTPSRANGLYSIHSRMKRDALRFLVKK